MITADLKKGTQVSISNGRHTWLADEPVEADGTDEGPNPYDLLLGALAACTCITLSLYCRHKNLPLDSINAQFEHERIHTSDCADCEDSKKGYIEQIKGKVRITGEFNDAQRKRLSQIVTRCPVHKTLSNDIKFVDDIEFA